MPDFIDIYKLMSDQRAAPANPPATNADAINSDATKTADVGGKEGRADVAGGGDRANAGDPSEAVEEVNVDLKESHMPSGAVAMEKYDERNDAPGDNAPMNSFYIYPPTPRRTFTPYQSFLSRRRGASSLEAVPPFELLAAVCTSQWEATVASLLLAFEYQYYYDYKKMATRQGNKSHEAGDGDYAAFFGADAAPPPSLPRLPQPADLLAVTAATCLRMSSDCHASHGPSNPLCQNEAIGLLSLFPALVHHSWNTWLHGVLRQHGLCGGSASISSAGSINLIQLIKASLGAVANHNLGSPNVAPSPLPKGGPPARPQRASADGHYCSAAPVLCLFEAAPSTQNAVSSAAAPNSFTDAMRFACSGVVPAPRHAAGGSPYSSHIGTASGQPQWSNSQLIAQQALANNWRATQGAFAIPNPQGATASEAQGACLSNSTVRISSAHNGPGSSVVGTSALSSLVNVTTSSSITNKAIHYYNSVLEPQQCETDAAFELVSLFTKPFLEGDERAAMAPGGPLSLYLAARSAAAVGLPPSARGVYYAVLLRLPGPSTGRGISWLGVRAMADLEAKEMQRLLQGRPGARTPQGKAKGHGDRQAAKNNEGHAKTQESISLSIRLSTNSSTNMVFFIPSTPTSASSTPTSTRPPSNDIVPQSLLLWELHHGKGASGAAGPGSTTGTGSPTRRGSPVNSTAPVGSLPATYTPPLGYCHELPAPLRRQVATAVASTVDMHSSYFVAAEEVAGVLGFELQSALRESRCARAERLLLDMTGISEADGCQSVGEDHSGQHGMNIDIDAILIDRVKHLTPMIGVTCEGLATERWGTCAEEAMDSAASAPLKPHLRHSPAPHVSALAPLLLTSAPYTLAPLLFVVKDLAAAYLLHRGMMRLLWAPMTGCGSYLHQPSAGRPSYPAVGSPALLHLCCCFDTIMAARSPRLAVHMHTVLSLSPLGVAFPWLLSGFAGVLRTEEVLAVWDRALALLRWGTPQPQPRGTMAGRLSPGPAHQPGHAISDSGWVLSVAWLAAVAVALLDLRAEMALQCSKRKDVIVLYSDFSSVTIMPLMAEFFSEPE